MSILSKIKSGVSPRAQKIVIYAPEGFGKSTLASQFPSPLFLDIEGSTSQMSVNRLDRDDIPDIKSVKSVVREIIATRACETVVVDTGDWLESMVLDDIISSQVGGKIKGLEDFGFGKGYTYLKEGFEEMLEEFGKLISAGINVVILLHSKITKFEPPDGAGAYDRYELKLSKQVAPLVKEWADMVIFGNWKTQIAEKGKGDSVTYKGVNGRIRELYANRCASWDAKNRHGIADSDKWEIATIQKAFANVGVPWGGIQPPERSVTVPPVRQAPATAARRPAGQPAATQAAPAATATIPAASTGNVDYLPAVEAVIKGREDDVTAWLLQIARITEGQSWRDMDAKIAAQLTARPTDFIATLDRFVAERAAKAAETAAAPAGVEVPAVEAEPEEKEESREAIEAANGIHGQQ